MPKKLHIAHVRLTKKNLDNFMKSKSFTVTQSSQENEDNTVVKLIFKAKKNLTKLNKNLSMGKGTRIQPFDLEDMEIHSGDGFFSGLKGVMGSKLTKGIVKAVAPQVANIVGNQVKNLTGSDMAGNLTKTLVNEGSNQMTGNGIFDSMKGVMNSKLTKGIVKAVAPQVANIVGTQVKNLTGSDMAGNLTKTLVNEGSNQMTGNGYSRRGGSFLPLGGSVNPNQYVGISYNSPDFSNPSERMAYVRSHRRSNGVVM
jgi:hypothetical protein